MNPMNIVSFDSESAEMQSLKVGRKISLFLYFHLEYQIKTQGKSDCTLYFNL